MGNPLVSNRRSYLEDDRCHVADGENNEQYRRSTLL